MFYAPVSNIDLGPIILLFSCATPTSFLLVILIEALVLWQLLEWGRFLRCLRDSFLVNLATTVLGVVFALFLGNWFAALFNPLLLAIGSTFSAVIEGLLLMCIQRRQARETFVASMSMNFASYVFLQLVIFGFLWRVIGPRSLTF